MKRGMNVDDFAGRLAFFFNCHNNFLEEVAKFRAARRLWARIMRNRFGAKSDRACMLRFHTQTAGSSLTAQQPLVNVVRTTVQALAAILGGTQSLHTNSFDEAIGLPTEEAASIALRTQQVLAHESGLADFIDPLGGSYTIERLTNQIERDAQDLIDRLDEHGGMVPAIEAGLPQRAIEESAFRYQQGIEQKSIRVVGVNVATEGGTARTLQPLRIDPKVESEQRARIAAYRLARDPSIVGHCLLELRHAAQEARNLMPATIAAVEAKATLGEISDVLREVYGEHSA